MKERAEEKPEDFWYQFDIVIRCLWNASEKC